MATSYNLAVAVTLLFVAGCDWIRHDPPAQDEARIVLGRSVDGVRIGDDTTLVVEKLGRPDEVGQGDYPGVSFNYTRGKYAGLSLSIWTDHGEGVQVVSLQSPYAGKTAEGVGIGSSRGDVIQALGSPDEVGDASGSVVNIYYRNGLRHGFVYVSDVVTSLTVRER